MATCKTMLRAALEAARKNGRVWSKRKGYVENHVEVIEEVLFLKGAEMRINFAYSALAPRLFEQAIMIKVLERCLKAGAKILIIVNSGKNSEQALEILKRNNPKLLKLWRKEKKERENVCEQSRIAVYWSPKGSLAQNFVVLQDVGVIFDRPDRAKNVVAFVKDKKLAYNWMGAFNALAVKIGRAIELPS